LTGEAESTDKNAEDIYMEEIPLGDRCNVIFAGTAVTRGNGYAIVTETGMQTEVGKISNMLTGDKNSKTPLDVELDKLGKAIIIAALVAAFAVLIAGILTDQQFIEMAHIAIILAVAAIPEAMPAVSTITLSRGMKTMAEHKALVKSLSAVETLGATSIIASDKTGTLTENQMTVTAITLSSGEKYTVTGNGYEPSGSFLENGKIISVNDHPDLAEIILNGALCTTSTLKEDNGHFEILGDPTDGAFVVLGQKEGISRQTLLKKGTVKIAELPFNSDNKFMISVYEKDAKRTLIMKGAPDVLIELAHPEKQVKEKFFHINHKLASSGQRVMAVAQIKDYTGGLTEDELLHSFNGLKIQGFFGIVDPPRKDIKESIKIAQEAGIQVKMITGDHPQTASMIAREIGLNSYANTMTGIEIDRFYKDGKLKEHIADTAVFARVSPENKLQLVKALKEAGNIVSMTGDGVNDAPA
ncbi:cation-transporting P-type ATPase, partial [Enterococcus casseliflavus]|uniref:HAD-IC family P-type ATPase n=2 Tax=Enterococcus TaxID=1350 RepID=UPI0010274AC6